MMSPPEHDPNDPYPSVRAAFVLTLMAVVASLFTTIALYGLGALAAYGVGRAIGVGAVASMGAQRVPEPPAERIGLRRLDWEALPLILCLVPAILLTSELDNFLHDYAGDQPSLLQGVEPPAEPDASDAAFETADTLVDDYDVGTQEPPDTLVDGEAAPVDEPVRILEPDAAASMIQGFIVMVGIIPIVDCFLFFGVIQQGLIRRRGLVQGALYAGLFWMLMRDPPIQGMARFLMGSVALLGLGWILGIVRVATRSILGPMLLAASWAAIGFFAVAYEGIIDLPGMNVPGTHLPVLVSVSSLGIVAWAGTALFEEAKKQFALEDAEGHEASRLDEDDDQ